MKEVNGQPDYSPFVFYQTVEKQPENRQTWDSD